VTLYRLEDKGYVESYFGGATQVSISNEPLAVDSRTPKLMSTPKPPQLFVRLFKWYCRGDLQEAILGDIEEEYDDDFPVQGKKYADRRFVWTVIRSSGHRLS